MSESHRYAEDGVRAEHALVRSAIESDEGFVERRLVELLACDRRRDLCVHISDCLCDAFAAVAFLVAVAKLYRLMAAGRCS